MLWARGQTRISMITIAKVTVPIVPTSAGIRLALWLSALRIDQITTKVAIEAMNPT